MGNQYFESVPATGSQERVIEVALSDRTLSLVTDTQVFSKGKLDDGTRILLEHAPPPDEGPALDLGCGYGAIAIVLALRHPGLEVTAIDINERARALTRENAARNGVAITVPDPPFEARTFRHIYSNPPVRIGKEELHALLATWCSTLAPEGAAYFVMSKHLGADSISAWLESRGYPTTRLASKQGYRILEVRACPL